MQMHIDKPSFHQEQPQILKANIKTQKSLINGKRKIPKGQIKK